MRRPSNSSAPYVQGAASLTSAMTTRACFAARARRYCNPVLAVGTDPAELNHRVPGAPPSSAAPASAAGRSSVCNRRDQGAWHAAVPVAGLHQRTAARRTSSSINISATPASSCPIAPATIRCRSATSPATATSGRTRRRRGRQAGRRPCRPWAGSSTPRITKALCQNGWRLLLRAR